MSKHRRDEKVSPLVWLIPVPFILAGFLPLTIEHPTPAKTQQMASASDSDSAASSPRLPNQAE